MKFTIENEALNRALGILKGCVRSTATMPLLEHICVHANGDARVSMRATDLEREAEVWVPAEVDVAGSAALPGALLTDLAKRLPKGGQACLVLGEDARARVTAGKSKYGLRTLAAEDYPEPREAPAGSVEFAVASSTLKSMLASTVYASSANSGHLYCRGVCLQVRGQRLIAVALDHKRVGIEYTDLPKGAALMPEVIIPTGAAQEMIRILDAAGDEVVLLCSRTAIEMRFGAVRFNTALIAADYPDYEAASGWPKPEDIDILVRPYAFAEALSRAMVVLASERGGGAQVLVTAKDNVLRIDAGARAADRAEEEVECETNGISISCAFNAQFLAESLGMWPESVEIGFRQAAPARPVLFSAKELPRVWHLLMPQIAKHGSET